MSCIIDGSAGITTPGVVNTAGETIATTLVVTGVTTLTGGLNAALPVLSGGTGVTTKTGTGAVVLGTAPTITGATITVAATAAPAFSAYLSTNQSVTTTVSTKLTLNTEEFDTNNNFDSTTNYRFTPTVSGYYQVSGSIYPATNVTTVQSQIYKNGAIFKISGNVAATTQTSAPISALIYMNGSTDYLEFYVYLAGASPSVLGGNSTPVTWFSAAMIRSA